MVAVSQDQGYVRICGEWLIGEKDNKDMLNYVGNTDILVDMDYNDNLDGNADKLVDKETIMTSCNKMVLLYRL